MQTPCVEFQGAVDKWGYGRQGHLGHTVYSHRLAYAQANGLDVLTMGGVVMHSCDNPTCINPDHLNLGDSARNSADMVRKGRQAQGSARPSKLTEAEVLEIRRIHIPRSKGAQSNSTLLCTRYGIAMATIANIVHRRTWKHA